MEVNNFDDNDDDDDDILDYKKKMMTVLKNFARMMKSVVVESAPALAISFASASALVAWSPP